jgi:two-component system response regulator HydG
VDVRIIAATHRDLKADVAAGRFREDLYYRLNVINIEMPSLRARASDIPLLATHFLRRYAGDNGKSIEGFADDALARLSGYQWPGNVRELENVIERAVVLSASARVSAAELPPHIVPKQETAGIHIPGSTLEEIERFAILTALEATGGSTSKAADMLGISVRKIQYKLHEYQSAPKSATDILKEPGKEPVKEEHAEAEPV